MKVEVYGSSDDNIIVEGGKLTDEFSAWSCAKFLHFSDGTVIECEYGPKDVDYLWRFKVLKTGEGTTIERVDGSYADEGPDDKLILTGEFTGVECYGSAEGPTRDDIETFFDNLDYRDLTMAQRIEVMRICKNRESA